jgi:PAS domain S-box-containing protein/diguanylate cyclase (GGDEF)-like protein
MVIDILVNMALLLSLCVLYATFPAKGGKGIGLHWVFQGLALGLCGLLVMLRPYTVAEGVVFDSRTVLLTVSAMAFGLFPSVIAFLPMAGYRIWIGGTGMASGLLSMGFSVLVGAIWHRFRYRKVLATSPFLGLEYLGVGFASQLTMYLSLVLLPQPVRSVVVEHLRYHILFLYPFLTYLSSLLVFGQMERVRTLQDLKDSETRFRTMFDQAPIGMSLTDFSTGRILDVNRKYEEILGITRERLLQMQWKDVTFPEDLSVSSELEKRMTSGEDGPFVAEKRFVRGNGRLVWARMELSVILLGNGRKRQSLCMVTDITAQKDEERRLGAAISVDHLTGLYNRWHFENHVGNLSLKGAVPFSVVFGDLNGLRIVNEAFGRDEGNRLLGQLAEIVKLLVRDQDYAARVGGDEIALLLPNTEKESAEQLTLAIQEQVAALSIKGTLHPSITFGLWELRSEEEDINEGIRQAENLVRHNKLLETPQLRGHAVYAIINMLHEKSKREELHSQRVAVICQDFCRALGFGERQINEMRLLGLLHDIGKIAIGESILDKEGPLTREEWEEMKRHPEIGYRILSAVDQMHALAPYVLAHHERFDGRGYPKGLDGYRIPLQSRIIAIADSYDAMTGERTYRESVSVQKAAVEIKRNAGTQFDPDLARIFVEKVLGFGWEMPS